MRPDQTEGIDEARRNEPIYPLDEWITKPLRGGTGGKRRSVNERLAPIFAALADDPDGWKLEVEYESGRWKKANRIPLSDPDVASSTLDYIRLVPKRKTITVEIDLPTAVDMAYSDGRGLYIEFDKPDQGRRNSQAIRKAMEGK